MSQLKNLLEKAIGEIVAAAGCADISKASLEIKGRHSSSRLLEIIRIGNVFEAQFANREHFSANNAEQLRSELLACCLSACESESDVEVLLRAEPVDNERYIPASKLGISGTELVFKQIDQKIAGMIESGLEIAQEELAEGRIRSARLLLNDGSKFWTICLYDDSAYSNDFDLFIGAPPSFHCSGKPAQLKSRVQSFLSECFIASASLRVRLLMDSSSGNQLPELVADSQKGGSYAEPEIFDPPV